MKIKERLKIAIDVLMVLGMFGAMNYQIWSGSTHKRISAVLYLLFLLHNFLNYRWYQTLLRGKYKPFRVIQTAVNLLVLFSMAVVMYSGVLLAKETAAGIVTDGISGARRLHIAASHTGSLGMAVHMGLHIKMIRLQILKFTRRFENHDR